MRKHGCLFLILTAAAFGLIGCGKTQGVSAVTSQADGNLAQAGNPDQPDAGQPVGAYPAPEPPTDNTPTYAQAYQPAYDQAYQQDANESGPAVYASEPPPPLPEYNQPPCPGDNYIWTPGYWGYGDSDYYWVPGVWVMAPYVDALWTPPYWESYGGRYRWHRGYWGNHIGFYGGINYGFGYTGRGYYGGHWDGGRFAYNRTVTNVNVNIVHNVYERKVANTAINHISYNGGHGGINARPIAAEAAALRERRTPPVAAQLQHARSAEGNRQQFASVNRGRPALVAQNNALATPYRAPASRPEGPELPRRAVQTQSPRAAQAPAPVQAPVQNERPFAPGSRPGQIQQPAGRGGRPEAGGQAPESTPVTPEARPVAPGQRSPEGRGSGGRQETQRPQGQVRQEPVAPAQQPRSQPEFARPVPQARPLTPESRQAPQVREARPAPQGRAPFERGAPARPDVQARPEREARPQQQARPEPQARPAAPPPAARPQLQARPEPAARPAAPPPQATRSAPEGRGAPGRGEDKRR